MTAKIFSHLKVWTSVLSFSVSTTTVDCLLFLPPCVSALFFSSLLPQLFNAVSPLIGLIVCPLISNSLGWYIMAK